MKKTITIFGQPVELAFNLAAQIAWEDITGKAFDISDIKSRKDAIALFMACIIAGNSDTTITIDKLMFELSFDDIQVLDNAIGDLIREWYHLPATAQKEEPSHKVKKHPKRS